MNINKTSGAMKATGNGTATITAKATDGSGVTAACKVNGTVLVNDFWFNQTEHTMYHYQYMQMGYTWTPWNAKDPSLKWESSDKDIATVDQNGTVYSNNGIWNGSAWITGTTVDGSNITRSFLVHVKEAFVEGISLSPSNLSLNAGDGCGLSWTMWPSYAANKSISWSSSNESVATVSGGWVAAKGAGTCTITATTYLGYSASCTVTVTGNASSGGGNNGGGNNNGGNNGGNNNNGNGNPRDSGAVSYITMIASKTMIVGENSGIFATISPASSSSKITWGSSDKNIATVNSNGQVTAKKAGTVKITAKAGAKSATCTVTVKDISNVQVDGVNIGDVLIALANTGIDISEIILKAMNPAILYDQNAKQDLIKSIVHLLIANEACVYFTKNASDYPWLKDVFWLAGFEQDESTGTFHARQDCLQQYGGYNDFYDFVFYTATDMDKDKFQFTYKGQNYILWAWKGDYLNLGAGAELGMYYRFGNTEHWLCATEDATPMALRLKLSGRNIINYNPTEPQWWVTGFNPDYQRKIASNMTATYTVNFGSNEEMYSACKSSRYFRTDRWTFYGNDRNNLKAILTF